MDLTPEQIRDDLRKPFRGGLHFDDLTRGLYATDARPVSGSVFARYRVAKAAALWFDWRIERLAPSGDSRVPLAPTGSRTVNRLTLGATFMALD